MCGIAGIFDLSGEPIKLNLLKQMTDSIAHRGPDGDGFYSDGAIGLGHRRLAIIDLSPAGKQPISNEDQTIWITFNGEIYNFAEIHRELMGKGHQFKSNTDTEVIVHAYEEWGTNCLERLNGMFAFGLWDVRRSRLWLVRDRLGVKPLFYWYSQDRLLFASEIKAILCDPRVERQVELKALAYFLALNYMPAPFTLFKNIQQLLPGEYLLVDASGHAERKIYWDVVYQEPGPFTKESEYAEKLAHLLDDSIRMRLVSDVPFGAFLSGGVDSSTVAYWMSRNMKEPVKTFSMGFEEASFNELAYARQVANLIHSEHYEQIIKAEAAEMLPELVWHGEEPTADSSMLAVYYLAQMTRKHVKMVLSGDGADEILAGYDTYSAHYILRLYQMFPRWMRKNAESFLLKYLPVSDAKVNNYEKVRRFFYGASYSLEDAHGTWRVIFNREETRQILSPLIDSISDKADVIELYRAEFSRTNAQHPLNRMLYVDTRFYLPNDMLVKVDRMTMAHGLEAREPFLDYRLVEFVASIPPDLKLKNFFQRKHILKNVMEGRLPHDILRRKKAGFNIPNASWIKGALKPFVLDTLSSAIIHEMGMLDANVVKNILTEHFSGRAEHSHQIWGLLSLVLWWKQFIKAG